MKSQPKTPRYKTVVAKKKTGWVESCEIQIGGQGLCKNAVDHINNDDLAGHKTFR